jgi:hypothetical protein
MKLFCIQEVVKPKASELCKYLLIHKEAVKKITKIQVREALRRSFPRWTIVLGAGILIAPWGHL